MILRAFEAGVLDRAVSFVQGLHLAGGDALLVGPAFEHVGVPLFGELAVAAFDGARGRPARELHERVVREEPLVLFDAPVHGQAEPLYVLEADSDAALGLGREDVAAQLDFSSQRFLVRRVLIRSTSSSPTSRADRPFPPTPR